MKIEIDLDIAQQALIGQVVQSILTNTFVDDEGEPVERSAGIEREVRDSIDKIVREECQALLREKLSVIIDEQLAAFTVRETNSYGAPTGPPMDLPAYLRREVIEGALCISSRSGGIADTLRHARAEWIRKTIQPMLDEAATKFKAEIGTVLTAKLGDALRKAVGLGGE